MWPVVPLLTSTSRTFHIMAVEQGPHLLPYPEAWGWRTWAGGVRGLQAGRSEATAAEEAPEELDNNRQVLTTVLVFRGHQGSRGRAAQFGEGPHEIAACGVTLEAVVP